MVFPPLSFFLNFIFTPARFSFFFTTPTKKTMAKAIQWINLLKDDEKVPLIELDDFFKKKTFLKSKWVQEKFYYNEKFLRLASDAPMMLKERNPRLEGHWTKNYQYRDEDGAEARANNAVLFWEILACRGNGSCVLDGPKRNKKYPCNAVVKWIIHATSPDRVRIEIANTHGDRFSPRLVKHIPKKLRDEMNSMFERGVPPAKVAAQIRAQVVREDVNALRENSGLALDTQKVTNLRKTFQRKQMRGKDEEQRVHNLLHDPNNARYILYPVEGKDFPKKGMDEKWLIVLSTDEMITNLAKYGKNLIYLDSVFKIIVTKDEYGVRKRPIWNVVFLDEIEGSVGAVIIASHNEAPLLKQGLEIVKTAVVAKSQDPGWFPKVMIDLDKTEIKACKSLYWEVLYCEFHLTKILSVRFNRVGVSEEATGKIWSLWKTIQRSSSDAMAKATIVRMNEELLQLAKPSEVDDFMEYLDTFFFKSQEIRSRWIDYNRRTADLDIRTSATNTNNYSEAQFKLYIYTYFDGRTHFSLSRGLFQFFEMVLPNLLCKSIQKQHNLKPKRIKRTSSKVRSVEAAGYSLYLANKCTPIQEYPGCFQVQSGTQEGVSYKVTSRGICQCKFYLWSGMKCKHYACVRYFLGVDVPSRLEPSIQILEEEASDVEWSADSTNFMDGASAEAVLQQHLQISSGETTQEIEEELVPDDNEYEDPPPVLAQGRPVNQVPRSEKFHKKTSKRAKRFQSIRNGVETELLVEMQQQLEESTSPNLVQEEPEEMSPEQVEEPTPPVSPIPHPPGASSLVEPPSIQSSLEASFLYELDEYPTCSSTLDSLTSLFSIFHTVPQINPPLGVTRTAPQQHVTLPVNNQEVEYFKEKKREAEERKLQEEKEKERKENERRRLEEEKRKVQVRLQQVEKEKEEERKRRAPQTVARPIPGQEVLANTQKAIARANASLLEARKSKEAQQQREEEEFQERQRARQEKRKNAGGSKAKEKSRGRKRKEVPVATASIPSPTPSLLDISGQTPPETPKVKKARTRHHNNYVTIEPKLPSQFKRFHHELETVARKSSNAPRITRRMST